MDNPFRTSFTQRTIIKPVVSQPENFPVFASTRKLENRVHQNVLMSDVFGLITVVSNMLPPSGGAREQRRQIYITAGQFTAERYLKYLQPSANLSLLPER